MSDARLIAKDGCWLVPVESRPKGWESMGLSEPTSAATPLLDAIASEPEEPKLSRWEQICQDYEPLREAIRLDAVEFGADSKTEIAAEVMVAGMWTRNREELTRLIGAPWAVISVASARFEKSGIWRQDGTVVLGDMDGIHQATIEFWCNAMVGAGRIDGEYKDDGMHYRAKQAVA